MKKATQAIQTAKPVRVQQQLALVKETKDTHGVSELREPPSVAKALGRLSKPKGTILRVGSEAISNDPSDDLLGCTKRDELLDTLRDPSKISLQASMQRMQLLHAAGVLEMALDAAETFNPKDSLERMLLDQVTASHFAGMKCLAEAQDTKNSSDHRSASYKNATRLFDASQAGYLALLKIRKRGQQRSLVQSV